MINKNYNGLYLDHIRGLQLRYSPLFVCKLSYHYTYQFGARRCRGSFRSTQLTLGLRKRSKGGSSPRSKTAPRSLRSLRAGCGRRGK